MRINSKNISILLLIAGMNVANANDFLILAEVSLDDAVKQVINGNRLLDAETQLIDDRKIHVIKVLTEDGRVQKHKIDAESGKRLGKPKK